MSSLIERVSSMSEWDDIMLQSDIHVVHFATQDCESQDSFIEVVEECQSKFFQTLFAIVNIDTCPSLVAECSLLTFPCTAVLYEGGVSNIYYGTDKSELCALLLAEHDQIEENEAAEMSDETSSDEDTTGEDSSDNAEEKEKEKAEKDKEEEEEEEEEDSSSAEDSDAMKTTDLE